MITLITEAEAARIIDSDADMLPFRLLTAEGKEAVARFVAEEARSPERHDLGAWLDAAKRAADNALFGEAIVLEMPALESAAGTPATLDLTDHFSWALYSQP